MDTDLGQAREFKKHALVFQILEIEQGLKRAHGYMRTFGWLLLGSPVRCSLQRHPNLKGQIEAS